MPNWRLYRKNPLLEKIKDVWCLQIVFFEWQWQDPMGKKKQKYKIAIGQEELFMFAGLWDTWLDVATGELVYTFAVVTTEAQGIMRQIHNTKLRMPLVLTN